MPAAKTVKKSFGIVRFKSSKKFPGARSDSPPETESETTAASDAPPTGALQVNTDPTDAPIYKLRFSPMKPIQLPQSTGSTHRIGLSKPRQKTPSKIILSTPKPEISSDSDEDSPANEQFASPLKQLEDYGDRSHFACFSRHFTNFLFRSSHFNVLSFSCYECF